MIYLDNAATTKTAPEVVQAMLPFFSEMYGNPSSVYQLGSRSKAAIAKSREQIAELIGAKAEEIFFTSGGSEADNWALKSVFEISREKGNHIITTGIEHPAILRTCEYLEREYGAKITYLPVDRDGFVNPADVERAITPETILISVMAANNEIGTIEPIREIGKIAHDHQILFHTDAVQAVGQIPINVDDWNVDLLSSSGHKLNGPKGIGFLYIRKGVPLRSFIHGGAQEHNRRAGTENVPAIVGFGEAARLAKERLKEKMRKETENRDYLIRRIRESIPHVKLNGPDPEAAASENFGSLGPTRADADAKTADDARRGEGQNPSAGGTGRRRLPNNVNFSFEFVEGESLLIMLDMQGICASSGSACSSGSLAPSHVLKAIGLSDSLAHGALRMTLSEETTREELDRTVDAIGKIVKRLRGMSPKYEACRLGQIQSET